MVRRPRKPFATQAFKATSQISGPINAIHFSTQRYIQSVNENIAAVSQFSTQSVRIQMETARVLTPI